MKIPLIVGHRGAPRYEPENTIPSFLKAIELGVDFIELDIRASKDQRLVVFHDELLTRLTGISAKVRDCTLSELRRLKVMGKARIPTLEEVLDEVGTRCGIVIEIKEPGLESSVIRILDEKGLISSSIIIASFYHSVVKRALEQEPRLRGMVIMSCEPVDPVAVARAAGAGFLAVYYKFATKRLIKLAHEGGVKVNVWTVNTIEVLKEMLDLGVDMITTDDPKLIRGNIA